MRKFGVSCFFLLLLCQQQLFSLSSERVNQAYNKSYIYEKIQDYKSSINALAAVKQEYPKGYTLNLRLGWLYYLNKNYANSLHHYQQAMKSVPHSIEAKLGYTYPLLAQAKYDQVASVAYSILQTDYYSYYGNLTLVKALQKQKKTDLAQKVCQKMLAIYPTDTPFLVELALTKIAAKDRKAAYAIFEDVLILNPENPVAKSYLQKNNSLKKRKR